MPLNTKSTDEQVNRRRFVGSLGAIGITGLAGCLGEDDDGAVVGDDDDGAVVGDDDDEEEDVGLPDTIEIIVPTDAGGASDFYSRTLAGYWPEYLPNNPEVEVTNLPGAGGSVGMQATWDSEPNGGTSMNRNPFNMVGQLVNPVDFDYREFSHLGAITDEPPSFLVREGLGVETYDEFVAEVRTGDTMVGTAGVGGQAHVGAIFMGDLTGDWDPEHLNFTHYDGAVNIAQGMLQGHIDWVPISDGTQGAIFANAVENSVPLMLFAEEDEYPDWLTDVYNSFAPEVGVENWDQIANMYGGKSVISDPPGTPDNIVEIKQDALMEVVEDSRFVEDVEDDGRSTFNPRTAEEMNLDDLLDDLYDHLTSEPLSSAIDQI